MTTTTPKRVAKRITQRDIVAHPTRRTSKLLKRGLIYARYSVEAEGKISDEMQVAECKGVGARKRIDIDPTLILVERGKSAGEGKKRPVFDHAKEIIASGNVEYLIVWRLDRCVRSLADWTDLWALCKKHGVQFISVVEDFDTSLPMGKAMIDIVAVFAELERSIICGRNAAIASHRRTNGLPPGGVPPYGYVRIGSGEDQRFVIDDARAAAVRTAARAILDGRSLRWCCQMLNDIGAPPPDGTKRASGVWKYNTLRVILSKPAIAGLRDNGDDFIEAGWEPIIDVETWHALLDAFADPSRKVTTLLPGREGAVNLLTGLIRCGKCDTPLRPARDSGKGGTGTMRYRCTKGGTRAPNACCGTSVAADLAEAKVLGELFASMRGEMIAPIVLPDDDRAAELREEIDELDRLYGLHAFGRGKAGVTKWQGLRSPLQVELDEIDEAEEALNTPTSMIAKLVGAGVDIAAVWDTPVLDMPTKRAVIREAFPEMKLLYGGNRRMPNSSAIDRLVVE